MKKRAFILCLTLMLTVSILSGCDSSVYKDAEVLFADGIYDQAKVLYETIPDHKDAEAKIELCRQHIEFEAGESAMQNGEFEAAIEHFSGCETIPEAAEKAKQCRLELDYLEAVALFDEGLYEKAMDLFSNCEGLHDSDAMAEECRNLIAYGEAKTMMYEGSFDSAANAFDELNGYSDADAQAKDCRYLYLMDEIHSGYNYHVDADHVISSIDDLIEGFTALGDHLDCAEMAEIFRLIRDGDHASAGEKAYELYYSSGEGLTESDWSELFTDIYYDVQYAEGHTTDDVLAASYAASLFTNRNTSYYYMNSFIVSEDIWSEIKGEGTGRILIVNKDTSMGNDSLYINISAMQSLPYTKMARSVQEAEYVILTKRDHIQTCTYTSGTKGVRVRDQISLVHYPDGRTVKSYNTVTGPEPPYSFTYYNAAPTYKSGGYPDTDALNGNFFDALKYLGVVFEEDGFTFYKEDDCAFILKCKNSEKLAALPDTLGGCPVTGFSGDIFTNCQLTEISLPDTITHLPESAFSSCVKLEKLRLGAGIRYLPMYMCDCCYALCEVELPENLRFIDNTAFSGCTSLKNIVLPSGVRLIYCDAFAQNVWKYGVTLNDGLRIIIGYESDPVYYDDTPSLTAEDIEIICEGLREHCDAVRDDPLLMYDVPEFLYDYWEVCDEYLAFLDTIPSVDEIEYDLDAGAEDFIEEVGFLIEAYEELGKALGSESISSDGASVALPASLVKLSGYLPTGVSFTAVPGSLGEWFIGK